MKKKALMFCGGCAGIVNGLFGAGGGMVLLPLLRRTQAVQEQELFPSSLSILLPICLVSLVLTPGPMPWKDSLPYLLGSGLGGVIAGFLAPKIPTVWLHRVLGVMILWGGVRYLW